MNPPPPPPKKKKNQKKKNQKKKKKKTSIAKALSLAMKVKADILSMSGNVPW